MLRNPGCAHSMQLKIVVCGMGAVQDLGGDCFAFNVFLKVVFHCPFEIWLSKMCLRLDVGASSALC